MSADSASLRRHYALQRARELSVGMRAAAEDLRVLVEEARRLGASWQAIADAVGPEPHRPTGASATAMRRFYDQSAR